jgi:Xaa-Pro aminopeptidase
MPLDIHRIKNHLKDSIFFTGNVELISFLIEHNLEQSNEYALIISPDSNILIAQEEINLDDLEDIEIIQYVGSTSEKYIDLINHVIDIVKTHAITQVNLSYTYEKAIFMKSFMDQGIEVQDISGKLTAWALVKSPRQIRNIKRAISLNEEAYRAIKEQYRLGMSELEILSIIKSTYFMETKENISFICDLISGSRTAEISGYPTTQIPVQNDTIIADLLPVYQGIWADTTRTYYVKEPTKEQLKLHEIINLALIETEKMLKPGTIAGDLYHKVNEVLLNHGIEQALPHHAGHGFGLTMYEAPYFLANEKDVLQENMVVTLEPGVYLSNEFGIRLENNYVITKTGCEKISKTSTNIEDYIIG